MKTIISPKIISLKSFTSYLLWKKTEKNFRASFKKEAGFTLIEVLVAIFILVVGIVAVLDIFPLGTKIWKSAEMATIASQLGQAKMEEIISKSYNEISIGVIEAKHNLDPPFSFYQRETKVICVDPNSNLSEVVNCSPDPGIKKIEVTIFWKSPLHISEKSINLSSLIVER